MRWRLILEEFGPTLTYIKGEQNIVADTLSRLDLTEEEFSSDAFAGDLIGDFPFSYALIAQEQPNDPELMNRYATSDLYDKKVYKHSDKEYDLIVRTDEVTNQTKIVVPKTLQKKLTEWYHLHLLHPGETRTELTIGQHFYWKGIREQVARVCKSLRNLPTYQSPNQEVRSSACQGPGHTPMAHALYRPDRSLQDWQRQKRSSTSLSNDDRPSHRLARNRRNTQSQSRRDSQLSPNDVANTLPMAD